MAFVVIGLLLIVLKYGELTFAMSAIGSESMGGSGRPTIEKFLIETLCRGKLSVTLTPMTPGTARVRSIRLRKNLD